MFASCILYSQNVGINALNPQEQLHIRSDSTRMAIRLDSKKSAQAGFDYLTVTAMPSNALSIEFDPAWKNWTDLNHNKLVTSDDVRMNGPQLEIAPDWANILKVVFSPSGEIPTDAEITNVTLHTEWRRIGTFTGTMSFFLTLNKNSNNQQLLNFGLQQVSNSTDLVNALAYQTVTFPVTPDMVNLSDICLFIQPQLSYMTGFSRLEIDRLWLEIEYKVPSENNATVLWSVGAKEGEFSIANSSDINSKNYLTIDESGVTSLKGLKITKNAGPGKVLMSNNDGRGFWQELPYEASETLWFSKGDTAYYATGPVQAHNKIGDPAFIFDKGENRLNNSTNFAETDNRIFNIIIDADNDQVNEHFNIYKDSSAFDNEEPAVRFHLDGGDSWINSGHFGFGLNNPDASLHLLHGNDFNSEGLKLENSTSNTHWKFFSGSMGNLALFSSSYFLGEVGYFNGVSGAYSSISDRRRKKNITPVEKLLDRIILLEPVKYNFIQQKDTEDKTLGLIAQDVEILFPEAVMYDQENDTYTMDYSLFGVLAIQAIKEQQVIIDNLQSSIKKMEELELRIKTLEKVLTSSSTEMVKD